MKSNRQTMDLFEHRRSDCTDNKALLPEQAGLSMTGQLAQAASFGDFLCFACCVLHFSRSCILQCEAVYLTHIHCTFDAVTASKLHSSFQLADCEQHSSLYRQAQKAVIIARSQLYCLSCIGVCSADTGYTSEVTTVPERYMSKTR